MLSWVGVEVEAPVRMRIPCELFVPRAASLESHAQWVVAADHRVSTSMQKGYRGE